MFEGDADKFSELGAPEQISPLVSDQDEDIFEPFFDIN